jgi:hypothetical protein
MSRMIKIIKQLQFLKVTWVYTKEKIFCARKNLELFT